MNIRPILRQAGALALRFSVALLRLSATIGVAVFRPLRAFAGDPRMRAPFRSMVRIGVLALVIATLILGAGWYAVERVPPGVIAVRQVNWGPGAGIVERDYGAGFALVALGRTTWHELPARTHHVNFAWASEGGTHPMLAVSLQGGESAQVSVSVPYRIRRGEGWQLVQEGLKVDYPRRATAIIRRVLLEELAQLTTEEFADVDARAGVESAALERLNRELAACHLEALDVLISTVHFSNVYEKKMQEKQLDAQVRLTNNSLEDRKAQQLENRATVDALSLEEQQIVDGFEAALEGQRLRIERQILDVERSAADLSQRRRMEADAEYETLIAAGDLQLAKAEALRERLLNEALESPGGRLHLARQAAENLNFRSVILNSNDPRVPNVLDLDQMVELLLGRQDSSGDGR